MSQENVEIVRRHWEAWGRVFDGYWEKPQSLAAALETGDVGPAAEEMLRYLDPELEWNPIFTSDSFRGLRACATALNEWFEAARDYRFTLRAVSELGSDQVLAVLDGAFVGKGTGIHVNASIFAVMTLREGLIVRIDEYLQRSDALEAVGLSE